MSIETPQRARARVAALSRFAASDTARLTAARRDFEAAKLKAAVLHATLGAYPITAAQRDELVRLLWANIAPLNEAVAA